MCGIVGILSTCRGGQKAAGLLPPMLDVIRHRGPDAEGVWFDADAGIALGHRRLSILDLSPTGAQPMSSASGRFVISYNGELYNHLELRKSLELKRASWRGSSDTETLLAAIETFGLEAALRQANGMFAFALWDKKRRVLTLARDRFGEKPLYLFTSESEIVFASDLASVERFPGFDRRIDQQAVSHYFRRGWQHPDRTIWASVSKVPPGGIVEIDHRLHQKGRQYWNCSAEIAGSHLKSSDLNMEAACDRLDQTLTRAVGDRMISDVPLGAWLSGGVDSSIVVALMQKQSNRTIRTFSIGFSDGGYDESSYARAVAAHLGTDHTEAIMDTEKAISIIPELSSIYSEPFSDVSQLPTILLSRMTKEHVTVALTGDGADELFGGYNRHVLANSMAQYHLLASGIGKRAMRLAATLPPWLLRSAAALAGHNTLQFDDKYRKLQALLRADTPEALYHGLLDHIPPDAIGETAPGIEGLTTAPAPIKGLTAGQQLMHFDTNFYLPEDVLVKVDRAAMSASLETRAPFLDPDVFHLAWSLDPNLKISGKRNKAILRQLLGRYLPPELFERPKQGFSIPIGKWLTGPLRDWAEPMFEPHRFSGSHLFDPIGARSAWNALCRGDARYTDTVWDFLVFQSWAESRGIA